MLFTVEINTNRLIKKKDLNVSRDDVFLIFISNLFHKVDAAALNKR